MSNLIFTDEIISQITEPQSLYFKSYFKFLAQAPELEHRRNLLESNILLYSGDKRGKVIGDIQQGDKISTISTISEVITCGLLKSEFDKVIIEEPLEIVGGKTPDFWVEDSFALEVLTVFDVREHSLYTLAEVINSIPSEIKVILGPIHNYPEAQPKIKEIRKFFIDLFDENQGLTEMKPFIKRFQNGMVLQGYLVRGSLATQTLFTAIETHGFNEENDPNYYQSIRKRIKSKLTKYKSLTEGGFPLVLAIFNNNQWIHEEDFDNILFGDKEYIMDTEGQITGFTRKDGIIRPDLNRTLSGIIVKHDNIDHDYTLIKNPYAKVSVDNIEDRLSRAFKK